MPRPIDYLNELSFGESTMDRRWREAERALDRTRLEARQASQALQAAMEGRESEAFFGGDVGAAGGMSSNAAPPQEPQTLTLEGMARAWEQMMSGFGRIGPRAARQQQEMARQQQEMAYRQQQEARQGYGIAAGCTCPACRPDLHGGFGSPQQRDAYEAARREWEEQRRRHDVAEARSVALLNEWLSPSQRDQYARERCFMVTGSEGTRYRIEGYRTGNVAELDAAGNTVRSWCFGPAGDASQYTGDANLCQMIALQTDEAGAIRVANRTAGPPHPNERPRAMAPALRPGGMMFVNDSPY